MILLTTILVLKKFVQIIFNFICSKISQYVREMKQMIVKTPEDVVSGVSIHIFFESIKRGSLPNIKM